MTTKQWLEALWEGRVYVTDSRLWSKAEIADWNAKHPREEPKEAGVPTMARLEKALKDAGLAVVTEDEGKGYLVNEVTYGFLRVRWGARSIGIWTRSRKLWRSSKRWGLPR
jgi:hypothetical protein